MGRLGFVLGTAAKDHQEVLVDQMIDQLKAAPAAAGPVPVAPVPAALAAAGAS